MDSKYIRKIGLIIRITMLFTLVLISFTGCRIFRRPSCEIIEPIDNALFGKGELINVLVEAEDPNGNNLEVQFYINGEGVGSTTTFPYRFAWDTKGYEEGEYRINARVIDLDGWTGSDSARIIIGISSPRLNTSEVSSVTLTSAVVGGSILTHGGAPVFETGIYYGTNEEPEFNGQKQRTNRTEDIFTTAITGLNTNTKYYYKAYAANEEGESVGDQKNFRTLGNELGFFTDPRDGKEYQTVRIANQTWMAENLAWLPSVSQPDNGSKYNAEYYVYGYSGTDVESAKQEVGYKYGTLFNWKAAINACPEGWHLPTDEDWKRLETNLGMTDVSVNNAGWRGSIEGSMLKGREGWKTGGNGSNISDFSALPGGYRVSYGVTEFESIYSNFWTSSEFSNTDAWSRYLYYGNNGVYRGTFSKDFGFSVRCVKD